METALWGAAGALAPEVVRWFRIARDDSPQEWRRWSYWAATLAYIALGGLLAHLIAQPNPYAAFITGLSTEYAILGAVQSAMSSPNDADSGMPEELHTRATFISVATALLMRHASYLGRR